MGCGSVSKTKAPSLKVTNVEGLKIQPGTFVLENSRPFQEEYKIGKSLGTGAFGEVRRVIHRATQEGRAVKIFRKDLAVSASSQQKLMEEINILRSLDHPNIIRVYEFFEDAKRFYIVMEQCNGGELFEEILKRQNFNESHAATLLHQLFSTIAYLHDSGIIHRDLKPENILLEEKGDIMNMKLIDFGTAVRLPAGKTIKGAIGTAYYIAPEVLSGTYNFKCDLWSCGVIMFILLAGYPPFDGKNDEEILEKVKKSIYSFKNPAWKSVSAEAKDLISGLLAPSSTRLTAHQALSHPWLKSHSQSPIVNSEVVKSTLSNLSAFHNSSKLRDAVSTFITTQCVSVADTKELRKVFQAMDSNGDGKLSREELFDYYAKEMGPEQATEEVNRIMNEVDTDNSGFVDYTEFIKATLDYKTITSAGFLKRAFDVFDKDGSGTISASELKKLLAGGMICEDAIWNEIIKNVDDNGDGEIDYGEFEKIILSKI
jgi:calcium-dependent protein kinase